MDRGRVAVIPFFAGLPDQEIDAVARVASEVEFAAGQPVTTEGEFGHGLFVLEAGTAEISTNRTRVDQVGPGAVVGEIAVLASGRRTASVVATSAVRAIALFKRDAWNLEDEVPEAVCRLRAALEQHVGAASPSPIPDDE